MFRSDGLLVGTALTFLVSSGNQKRESPTVESIPNNPQTLKPRQVPQPVQIDFDLVGPNTLENIQCMPQPTLNDSRDFASDCLATFQSSFGAFDDDFDTIIVPAPFSQSGSLYLLIFQSEVFPGASGQVITDVNSFNSVF